MLDRPLPAVRDFSVSNVSNSPSRHPAAQSGALGASDMIDLDATLLQA
jgi:hypothetical protein